jgi:hypothetical protein
VHTHFSALSAIGVFLVVLIVGTAWRLAAYRLMASNRLELRNAGQAMIFQY